MTVTPEVIKVQLLACLPFRAEATCGQTRLFRGREHHAPVARRLACQRHGDVSQSAPRFDLTILCDERRQRVGSTEAVWVDLFVRFKLADLRQPFLEVLQIETRTCSLQK